MKIVSYIDCTNTSKTPLVGLVKDGRVLQLPQIDPDFSGITSAIGLFSRGSGALAKLEDRLQDHKLKGNEPLLGDCKFFAPICMPSKIIAIGLNYRDHCREQNVAIPTKPLVFAKFTTAIIGPGDAIRWSPRVTKQVDFEAELAVVIGNRARNVKEEDALSYVGGYTAANDVTARDLQYCDKQWVRGKSLDTFCPLGPVLVTSSEISNPNALAISTHLNGKVMQESSTAEMIFQLPHLISYLSQHFTLLPGDIVLTGTPNGVGVYQNPQVFMKDGDQIAITIEGIGTLANYCCVEE